MAEGGLEKLLRLMDTGPREPARHFSVRFVCVHMGRRGRLSATKESDQAATTGLTLTQARRLAGKMRGGAGGGRGCGYLVFDDYRRQIVDGRIAWKAKRG